MARQWHECSKSLKYLEVGLKAPVADKWHEHRKLMNFLTIVI
jgi:hypothetical protein